MSDEEITKPGNKKPPHPKRRLQSVPGQSPEIHLMSPNDYYSKERAERAGGQEFAAIVGRMLDDKFTILNAKLDNQGARLVELTDWSMNTEKQLSFFKLVACSAFVLAAITFGGMLALVLKNFPLVH